jgi:hypothetical protein
MGGHMKNLLFFEKLYTPSFITLVFWLQLFFVFLAGLTVMFANPFGFSFGMFLLGLIVWVAGAIFARIGCEVMIVFFKMNEALQDLRKK